MENNNRFEYTYTAPTERERKEAESIRKQYLIEEEKPDKLAKLRELDRRVKNPPQIFALSLGIVGTLIFGGGLTLILEAGWLLLGALLAVVGLVPLALAYPAHKKLSKKLKEKYREEILRLSEEILNEQKK